MGDGDERAIGRMLAGRRVAIVGLSDDPAKPSHRIAAYLLAAGYDLVGINPACRATLGVPCYPALADVPGGPVDVVNVFRRPAACEQVVRDAVAAGAKGVWLQSGIVNDDARRTAVAAGLDFVQDRCIMVEHAARRTGS